MLKQTDRRLYEYIQTDGCLFRTLQSFCEAMGNSNLTATEINRLHDYCIPRYMKDGMVDNQNRCYILDHVEVIRAAAYVLRLRNMHIEYACRKDLKDGEWVYSFGSDKLLDECNFFAGKIMLPNYGHFFRSDKHGGCIWNPGQSMSDELVSIRGYKLGI